VQFLTLLSNIKTLYTHLVLTLKLNLRLLFKSLSKIVYVTIAFDSFSLKKQKLSKLNYTFRNIFFTWNTMMTSKYRSSADPHRSFEDSEKKVSNLKILKDYSTNNYNLKNKNYLILGRNLSIKNYFTNLRLVLTKTLGFSFYYIQGFVFVLFVDACLTDDEPLWEPLEWSLVQTWILFIFTFAWIAENLIVSRYGSYYTGRDDKRGVWMSWYKTFWLIEGYYIINYAVAAIFVIVPFYFETNYNLSFTLDDTDTLGYFSLSSYRS
jgi:hypothetical protein